MAIYFVSVEKGSWERVLYLFLSVLYSISRPLSHISSATSVGLPMGVIEPSSSLVSSAVEFTAIHSTIRLRASPPPTSISITDIRFWVSVPVLSLQMTVAAPIVSQAWSLRTRLFSLSIRRILIARLTVTLIGRPSGTATTISVTAIITEANTN